MMDKELLIVRVYGDIFPTFLVTFPRVLYNYEWSSCMRYCILPYADEQKYRFGQYYRKDQDEDHGEFMVLPFLNRTETQAHFQIVCSVGAFSVKYLQGGLGTYLNNKAVLEYTPLAVGDLLHVKYLPRCLNGKERRWEQCSLYQKAFPWDGCQSVIFLFRDRQWEHPLSRDLTEPVNFDPSTSLALENSLIISKIFRFLPIPTLKICRLICKSWEIESTKLVKAGTVVKFRILRYNLPQHSTIFFRYLHEMMEFAHPNWDIEIGYEFRNPILPPREGREQEKFLLDFHTFFHNNCHCCHFHFNLKRLSITLATTYVHATIFLLKIFAPLRPETLEELHLNLRLVYEEGTRIWTTPTKLLEKIQLPSLKKFVLDFEPMLYFAGIQISIGEREYLIVVLKQIIKLAKFVQCIHIKSQRSEINLYFLKEIVGKFGNIPNFPDLRQIKIGKISCEGLLLLLDLKEDSLTNIEINGFENDCDRESLNSVLQRHKNSLESVTLDIPLGWGFYFLPPLPSLKKETIRFIYA